jgi:hypothetical protein
VTGLSEASSRQPEALTWSRLDLAIQSLLLGPGMTPGELDELL